MNTRADEAGIMATVERHLFTTVWLLACGLGLLGVLLANMVAT